MNVKLKVLSAAAIFFIGGELAMAQKKKVDTTATQNIEEVVVVAYGTQKKSEVAGSITTIKAKTIEQSQTPNAVQSLTGKVGGVQISSTSGQPGSEPQVRFRGIGSLSSSNNPLYVVDGVPYNGNVNAISSQDIESMTFLKDAAANALYGSRGANGVVIITTKKAKGKRVSITFDTKVGVNSRAVPEYDIITDPAEYYEVFYNRLKLDKMYNDGLTDTEASIYAAKNLIDGEQGLSYNAYNVANDQVIDPTTGKVRSGAKLLYHDDWAKAFFKPKLRQEYNINIAGASDKIDTYFSLGYLNDEGYVVNSGFDRYTGRLNTNFKISDKLKTGINLNYARTIQDSPLAGKSSGTYSNAISWARNIAPIYPIWARNADGSIAVDQNNNVIYDFGTTGGLMGLARPYGGTQNAYAQALLNKNTNTIDNVSGRAYFSYDFLNGFNFTYNLGYDLTSGDYIRYGTPVGGDDEGVNGRIVNASRKDYTVTNQQLLSWDKKLSKHKISIMIGHETSDLKSKMFAGSKTNIVIPNLNILSNAAKYSYVDSYNDNYRVEGYLSRLNYDYDSRYFINASFRRDGSSVFSPDSRWGNFFGLGAAWAVSNEAFLKDNKAIDNLRIKASYGEQGNDNLYYPSYVNINHRSFFGYDRNYSAYQTQYEVVPDASGNPTIMTVYEGNPDLKWETSQNLNAGFELGLFNRVQIEAQFFQRAVSDMLYNKPLPLSTGTAFISQNIGDMRNRGVEASISVDVLKSNDYTWTLFGNSTFYKNKITRLPSQFNSSYFMFKEGLSAYTYYMREFAGVDAANGDALWYMDKKDTTGNITERVTTNDYTKATLYISDKNANPKVYGGFGTSLQYKNWGLSANFAYQFGGYLFDGVYSDLLSSDSNGIGANYHKDILNSWTYNNTTSKMPAFDLTRTYQNGTSDMFLIKSDYISLEDVALTYDFNSDLVSQYGFSGLKFGLYGTNLAMWSKRKGLDPRLMSLGASDSNGQTLNRYGAVRTISFGLTAKF